MANPKLETVFLIVVFVSTAFGLGLDFLTEDEASENLESLGGEERLLLPIILGGTGLNVTSLATLATVAAAALMPILGLAALGLLLWAVVSQHSRDSGYGGTGYGGHHSSYSSSYRSLGMDDWESLSFLKWISVAEETYNKYEPMNIECQKRVICELYQNANAFGTPAHTFMKYFSYLHYAEVFNFPENIKELTRELLDAAERGRSLKKDCGKIFGDCQFSIKEIVDKYGHGRFSANKENKLK